MIGPAVARYDGREFAARIVFAWSCEDNYFVVAHGTRLIVEQPILNAISAVDPFSLRPILGAATQKGHCAAAFSDGKQAAVVLVNGAPHTLLDMLQVRAFTRSFLEGHGEALGQGRRNVSCIHVAELNSRLYAGRQAVGLDGRRQIDPRLGLSGDCRTRTRTGGNRQRTQDFCHGAVV
jgi:hypothetical protein